MAAGNVWEVKFNTTNSRQGPGESYPATGTLNKGQEVIEIEGSKDGWIHISSGYVNAKHLTWKASSSTINTITQNSGPISEKASKDVMENRGDNGIYAPEKITDFSESSEYLKSLNSPDEFFNINKLIGVFGLPYQFLPSTDTRTNGESRDDSLEGLGLEYSDKIVGRMPILFLAPGRPSFMTKYTDEQKQNVLMNIITDMGSRASSFISGLADLDDTTGRYYTFQYDVDKYYSFVNPMCRIAAIYLGIGDFKFGQAECLAKTNWRNFTSAGSSGIFSGAQEYFSIPFYLDSDPQVSESFDNSTTESSLASTVNGVSDLGRELRFLTGYSSSALNQDWFSQNADVKSNIELITNEIEGILGKGNFLTNLSKHLTTVASGGRLIFPQIWAESGLSRSYQVNIKLVSPDCNKVSVYMNVLVPLFHLLGMVAPQSLDSNPNGYVNPFIVRGIFKSHFNIDMGIITDMSVTRGGNCQWTVDGIPTSIEVSLSIKDLYDVLTISESKAGLQFDTMSNTAQMDYIANLCGVNMYKPEISRQLHMWVANASGSLQDVPTSIWTQINQKVGTGILNLFRGR